MRPRSSFISSSRPQKRSRRLHAVGTLVGWTLVWIFLADLGLGVALRYPTDHSVQPTELQQYFEYGRSLEGKLKRLISTDDKHAAPVATAGWLALECAAPIPAAPPRMTGVTIYGMSFSNRIAKQMEGLDATIASTTRSGPAAALNHSYSCFRMTDAANGDSNPVQIVGILASSVERILTLNAMTTSFEVPTPYSYPRYTLDSHRVLVMEEPIATSIQDLRDPTRWARFKEQLRRNDAFFDEFTMDETFADGSVLVRLLRRAYAQHLLNDRAHDLVGGDPRYVQNPNVGPVLDALLNDFARRVRSHHQIPIVLLIQDRPGVDALDRLLAPNLRAQGIPFVRTSDLVRTTDPANFLSDGHFTEAADRRVARRTLEVMREELSRPTGPVSAMTPGLNGARR